MNMRLGSTHIKTLMKLNEIALKHNCVISMGTNDNFDEDLTIDEFKEYFDDLTDEIIEDINDKLEVERSRGLFSHYWFELYDKNKGTYNVLTYSDIEMLIQFEDDAYSSYTINYDTEEFLNNNCDYGYCLYVSRNDQKIDGFKGVDTSGINVYREGMLLKFFGDLVCDYLGEERIVEVY